MTTQEPAAFRTASLSDAAAVAHLHADSWRRHYRGAYPDSFLDGPVDEDRLTVWSARLQDPLGTLTVLAEVSGDLVGFVHVVFNADPEWGALVDNLHVRHDSQRSGIASHLIRRVAVETAAVAPGSGMFLWVLEQNLRAQAFYRAIGGREADRRNANPPALPGVVTIRYVWPDPLRRARLRPASGSSFDAAGAS